MRTNEHFADLRSCGLEMELESINPYSRGELRALIACMMAAAAVAVISLMVCSLSFVQYGLTGILRAVMRLVPSVATISNATADPGASEVILAIQWPFLLLYLFLWFHFFPPWSRRMRQTISNSRQRFSIERRVISIAIGALFLGAWLLGDFNLIDFPTFFNGKYVSPIAGAVPQLKLIYASRVALSLYAWVGPIVESTILWMFLVIVLNAKIYLTHSRSGADAA
jgi:hypothetical protein